MEYHVVKKIITCWWPLSYLTYNLRSWSYSIASITGIANFSNDGSFAMKLIPRLHDTTGCQTEPVVQQVWQPVGCLFTRCRRLSNRLYNWTAGLTMGCIV